MKKAKIIAMKHPCGLGVARWVGDSWFATVSSQLANNSNSFEFGGLHLRVIGQAFTDQQLYFDRKIVMQDSLFALVIAFFYQFLFYVLRKFAPIEAMYRGVEEDQLFPNTTIVGFVSTYIINPVFFFGGDDD